jgi:secreted protein with Ig-like and vWFA domain
MPLLTLGLGLVSAAVIARGSRVVALVLAVVLFALAAMSLILLVILALDVPVVVRAVDPQLKPTLNKAIAKSSIMAVVYVALYTILGIQAARRRKFTSKGT